MLGRSGGLAPSFFLKFGIFPNPTPEARQAGFCVFFQKKSWAKVAFLSPVPNVDRSRSWPGPGPARPAGMCIFPTTFLDFRLLPTKNYRFGGRKTTKNLDFRTPAPMFTETGPGLWCGPTGLCGGPTGPVWWPRSPCVGSTQSLCGIHTVPMCGPGPVRFGTVRHGRFEKSAAPPRRTHTCKIAIPRCGGQV